MIKNHSLGILSLIAILPLGVTNGKPNHVIALYHVLGGRHHVEDALPRLMGITHSGPPERMDDPQWGEAVPSNVGNGLECCLT